MRSRGKFCAALVPAVVAAFCGALASAGASAVATFDVSGVKLGMTPPQVLAALAERVGDTVKISQIAKPCAKVHADAIAHGRAPDASNTCIEEIRYTRPGLQVTYDFVEDYPANPTVMHVFSLQYYQFDFKTPADRDAFRQKAYAKFGRPDVVIPDGLKAGNDGGAWCPHDAATHCWKPAAALAFGYPPNEAVVVTQSYAGSFDSGPLASFAANPELDDPLMTLQLSTYGATLALTDFRYGAERNTAIAHFFDTVKSGVKTTF